MIPILVDYASPSAISSDRSTATLGLGINARRPLRFVAKVKKEHRLAFRFGLSALGELVWSNDEWLSDGDYRALVLDPVVTVHHDRVFFEALSSDQSAYGALIMDRSIFEPEGQVETGTTNVDFTGWLKGALAEMRSSRETWFRAESAGIEVRTERAGGRFERKVELPSAWVRGFLEISAAMAFPGTRLRVRPVDLIAALRYLHFSKAKVSPRALRYELNPGQDAELVLEPWEKRIRLVGADHGRTEPRIIRTWGRRRLRLIEPLLPYADAVEIYLKGRAMPSFYVVDLGAIRFVLGLTGYTEQRLTDAGGFSLSASGMEPPPTAEVERALKMLETQQTLGAPELGRSEAEAARIMEALCRQGRAVMDLSSQRLRHRELFEAPIELGQLYPPSPQRIAARLFLSAGQVEVRQLTVQEKRKVRRFRSVEGPLVREVIYRDFEVSGSVGPEQAVQVTLSESGRIIFGRCGCAPFKAHLLTQGPCEHLLALSWASEAARKDLPSSVEADQAQLAPRAPPPDEEAPEEE